MAELDLEPWGDTQGAPYLDIAAARVAAWTDRGLHRPGDTVHLAALLRGADDRAPAAGLPIILRWLGSSDRELRSAIVTGREARTLGAASCGTTPTRAATGRCRAALWNRGPAGYPALAARH